MKRALLTKGHASKPGEQVQLFVPASEVSLPLPVPLQANFVFRATDYPRDYFVDGLIPEGE